MSNKSDGEVKYNFRRHTTASHPTILRDNASEEGLLCLLFIDARLDMPCNVCIIIRPNKSTLTSGAGCLLVSVIKIP